MALHQKTENKARSMIGEIATIKIDALSFMGWRYIRKLKTKHEA
jgi:hypothetical protein